jgi:hypothetical protein
MGCRRRNSASKSDTVGAGSFLLRAHCIAAATSLSSSGPDCCCGGGPSQSSNLRVVPGAPRKSPATAASSSAVTSRPSTARKWSPTSTARLRSAALCGTRRVTSNGPALAPPDRRKLRPTDPSTARTITAVRTPSSSRRPAPPAAGANGPSMDARPCQGYFLSRCVALASGLPCSK